MLLELRGVLDVDVGVLQLGRDQLELGVELSNAVLREQPQQVEAEDGKLPLRRRQYRRVGVVHLELRDVPLKGGDVHLPDGQQRAMLQDLASDEQLLVNQHTINRGGRRGHCMRLHIARTRAHVAGVSRGSALAEGPGLGVTAALATHQRCEREHGYLELREHGDCLVRLGLAGVVAFLELVEEAHHRREVGGSHAEARAEKGLCEFTEATGSSTQRK